MSASHPSASFLKSDAFVGLLLLAAAILALIVDNSSLATLYDRLLSSQFRVGFDGAMIDKPLLLWINDGLMAIFFLYVGLEVKREFLTGDLSNWNAASLPAVGAVGGMAAPALVFVLILAFSGASGGLYQGWAIPAATDIAFAIGLLGLIAARAPTSAKAFLLALAIFDDMGAIVIIALFYTASLSTASLLIALICTGLAFGINRLGVRNGVPYLLIGLVLWVSMLQSGVHATLGGVIIALAIPLKRSDGFLETLEHALKPWVVYMVMPIFAFANAGVSLAGFGLGTLLQPLSLGIALGLVIGKPLGILGLIWAAQRLRLVRLPADLTWPILTMVSLLAGIGFTMSLFIGSLAFADPDKAAAVRIGVLSGSLLAGIAAYVASRWAQPQTAAAPGNSG